MYEDQLRKSLDRIYIYTYICNLEAVGSSHATNKKIRKKRKKKKRRTKNAACFPHQTPFNKMKITR